MPDVGDTLATPASGVEVAAARSPSTELVRDRGWKSFRDSVSYEEELFRVVCGCNLQFIHPKICFSGQDRKRSNMRLTMLIFYAVELIKFISIVNLR